jgi:RNA polymerase sigma factor (sigma-70 family)
MDDITKYDSLIKRTLGSKIGPVKLKLTRDQKKDLTQDCYLALLENQDRLEGPDHEEQAEKICRSRIVEIIQPRAREGKGIRLVSADDPAVAKQVRDLVAPDDGQISESELHAAIETLDPEDREVIQQRFVWGLTQKQTCGKLNLTVEAVKWRQKRGIEMLKKYFEVNDES